VTGALLGFLLSPTTTRSTAPGAADCSGGEDVVRQNRGHEDPGLLLLARTNDPKTRPRARLKPFADLYNPCRRRETSFELEQLSLPTGPTTSTVKNIFNPPFPTRRP